MLRLLSEDAYVEAAKRWAGQADPDAIELAIDAFKRLKDRHVLRGSEGDIQAWTKKPFTDYQNFVLAKQDQHQQKSLLKAASKDVTRVFENDKVLVVVPNTWEAAQKYGDGTSWCIASRTARGHWDGYRKNNVKFYFIIPKSGDEKYAVEAHASYGGAEARLSVYDSQQTGKVELQDVLAEYSIPPNVIHNAFTWDDWLNALDHVKHSDGSVSINEHVNLSGMSLTELPFRFRRVRGNFTCIGNNLKHLRGSPRRVDGNFICSYNQITSLEGAPDYVGNVFDCSDNYSLTTLSGGPKVVKGGYYCAFCKLTNLIGAPVAVGGSLNCAHNRIVSLKGSPASVGDYFVCRFNQITSLEGSPMRVNGSFICTNNKVTSLVGAPRFVGLDFDVSENHLTALSGAPEHVGRNFMFDGNPLPAKIKPPKYVKRKRVTENCHESKRNFSTWNPEEKIYAEMRRLQHKGRYGIGAVNDDGDVRFNPASFEAAQQLAHGVGGNPWGRYRFRYFNGVVEWSDCASPPEDISSAVDAHLDKRGFPVKEQVSIYDRDYGDDGDDDTEDPAAHPYYRGRLGDSYAKERVSQLVDALLEG